MPYIINRKYGSESGKPLDANLVLRKLMLSMNVSDIAVDDSGASGFVDNQPLKIRYGKDSVHKVSIETDSQVGIETGRVLNQIYKDMNYTEIKGNNPKTNNFNGYAASKSATDSYFARID